MLFSWQDAYASLSKTKKKTVKPIKNSKSTEMERAPGDFIESFPSVV